MDQNKYEQLLTCCMLHTTAVSLLITAKILKKKRRNTRRWWVKPHLYPQVRNQIGAYNIVCTYFKLNDYEEFQQFFRMPFDDFEYLLNLTRARLQKNISRRQPISPEIRLSLTLHYLGHGGNIVSNALQFRVGISTFKAIIAETCKVISSMLLPLYVQLPNEESWLQIASDFYRKWNFPHCVGALDGKHVRIQCPPHGGSIFYNYKKFHSIVLMALSDAHSRITWFSIGDCGSNNDPGVFGATPFSAKLTNGQLDIPSSRPLPDTDIVLPFVIISDEIFGLSTSIMKPYKRTLALNYKEKIYNYRLSRARFTIECAFGILCTKWKILSDTLKCDLQNSINTVTSCVCLHNMLITRNQIVVEEPNIREYQIHNEPPNIAVRYLPHVIRSTFKEYFVSEQGAVPWQHLCI